MATNEENRLRSIVETAVDGIITINARGVIDSFNAAAEQIFGFAADEVIGKNVSVLMPAPYQAAHDGYLANYIATGEKKIIGVGREVVGRRKDHSKFPMRLAVGEFWLGDQRMFTGVVHDLTEQKQAEERALRSERLAAMGQMLSALTHESRNALQLTQANLELLGMELENHPEALHYVSRIQSTQNRIKRLFEELRDFAAPISLDLDKCNLGRIVAQVLNELSPLHSHKKIRLSEQADLVDLHCTADPFRMHQVFRNLLENSIAACPDVVSIQASWSHTELDNRPALRLSLSDNGPGLTAEQREKVFEPFFTTKTKGTGLGLAITKRIIESHRGQISIGKNRSMGAEFVITLPRQITCA